MVGRSGNTPPLFPHYTRSRETRAAATVLLSTLKLAGHGFVRRAGGLSEIPVWWHDGDMPKTLAAEGFSLAIEYYREEDGRWLADIAALPGVTAYGRSKK